MSKIILWGISSFIYLFIASSFAQDSISLELPDENYREDQFYIGITYNLITKVPNAINLDGISGGVRLGYLRDIPLNERRNFAIALGGGIAFDTYAQTLFIGEDASENTLFRTLISDTNFDTNRFSTADIEVPLEIRWRSSTASNYKFWRIYGGVKMNYTYWYRSFFSQPNNEVSQTDIPEFQPLRFAATLSLGYSTFNFYVAYTITPFFENATLEENLELVEFAPLKIGILFYIL